MEPGGVVQGRSRPPAALPGRGSSTSGGVSLVLDPPKWHGSGASPARPSGNLLSGECRPARSTGRLQRRSAGAGLHRSRPGQASGSGGAVPPSPHDGPFDRRARRRPPGTAPVNVADPGQDQQGDVGPGKEPPNLSQGGNGHHRVSHPVGPAYQQLRMPSPSKNDFTGTSCVALISHRVAGFIMKRS